MNNNFTIRTNHAVICLVLLLAGCASEPAPVLEPMLSGEQMLRESQGIASLGDRWKKGKQMVDRGNVLVRESK